MGFVLHLALSPATIINSLQGGRPYGQPVATIKKMQVDQSMQVATSTLGSTFPFTSVVGSEVERSTGKLDVVDSILETNQLNNY